MPHPPQIPLTPQTDERNFPRWEAHAPVGKSGSDYPKMMTHTVTRKDIEEWKEKNRYWDPANRSESWPSAPPRLGAQMAIMVTQEMVDEDLAKNVNDELVAENKEHEARIRVFLGLDKPAEGPKSTIIPIAASTDGWIEAPKPKRGRPKNPKLDVSN